MRCVSAASARGKRASSGALSIAPRDPATSAKFLTLRIVNATSCSGTVHPPPEHDRYVVPSESLNGLGDFGFKSADKDAGRPRHFTMSKRIDVNVSMSRDQQRSGEWSTCGGPDRWLDTDQQTRFAFQADVVTQDADSASLKLAGLIVVDQVHRAHACNHPRFGLAAPRVRSSP